MFDRHEVGARAILVGVPSHDQTVATTGDQHHIEFEELARSAGAEILGVVQSSRRRPDPKTFIGQGKVAEVAASVASNEADIVIFNTALSPAQERNLEREFHCRVLDRNGLILDIFAQRARSFEGKLQVELAQLRHLSTRLVRGWTHLERQKGGIGLRGPGETQLETDRRLLAIRIKQINRRLDQVRRQREQNRGSRRKAEIASAVLVGYTNAGKSTLFNSLTTGDVYAADQLFATLDTTLRKIELPGGQEAILADTVGFLSDLPHELIDAFHATLLETRDADLLLHVVDAANDHSAEQVQAVDEVLRLVGAQSIPQVLVMNKIDRTGQPGGIRYSSDGQIERIYVSAVTGEGIVDMQQALQALLQAERINGVLKLNARQGALRAALFEERAVRDESVESDGSTVLTLDLNRYRWHQLCKRYDVKATELLENATPVARQA